MLVVGVNVTYNDFGYRDCRLRCPLPYRRQGRLYVIDDADALGHVVMATSQEWNGLRITVTDPLRGAARSLRTVADKALGEEVAPVV